MGGGGGGGGGGGEEGKIYIFTEDIYIFQESSVKFVYNAPGEP